MACNIAALKRERPLAGIELGRLFHEVERAIQAGKLILKTGRARGEHGDGLEQSEQVGQESRQVAGAELALHAEDSAEQQQAGRGDGNDDLPRGINAAHPPPSVDFLPRHQVVVGGEGGGLAALAIEGAHDAHAAEGFSCMGIDMLPRRSNIPEKRPDSVDPGAVRHPDHWQHHQRPQKQFPSNPSENHQRSRKLYNSLARVVEEAEDQFTHAAGIVAKDARHAAALDVVDAVQGQAHGMVKRNAAGANDRLL